ncbi:hypothetical protein [Bradyrhizobium sp. USDA 336]|uniref:hypothetical protein n=1 Tax=Bradyrhizobium sp. USDA 336 TaxID=3156311 RepID=UPI003835104A
MNASSDSWAMWRLTMISPSNDGSIPGRAKSPWGLNTAELDLAKRPTHVENCSAKSQDLVRRRTLVIKSRNVCLEDFLHVRAESLGIAGTQLAILMAVTDLDTDAGVAAGMVAKLLKVVPSFITLHSKALEKVAYVQRKAGAKDGRVVQLSLTLKARKRLATITPRTGGTRSVHVR